MLSLIISYPSFTLKVSRSHAARRGKVANPRLGIGPQEAAPTCCSFLRSRSGSQWALECRILTGMAFQDFDRHAIVRLNSAVSNTNAVANTKGLIVQNAHSCYFTNIVPESQEIKRPRYDTVLVGAAQRPASAVADDGAVADRERADMPPCGKCARVSGRLTQC